TIRSSSTGARNGMSRSTSPPTGRKRSGSPVVSPTASSSRSPTRSSSSGRSSGCTKGQRRPAATWPDSRSSVPRRASSDDRADAREEVRWFPALVGNHVVDMLRYHDPATLPPELTEYVERRTSYDYYEHTVKGAEHSAYVPDEIVDRFSVIGTGA